MTIATPEQLAAFHATHYRVQDPAGAFTLRIGEASARLRALHLAHGCASSAYLTAWNPLGRLAPAGQNAARQAALLRDLDAIGLPVLPGEGADPATGWAEASMLVLGIERELALALGRRYEQLAILFCGADAVPALVLLR